MKILNFQLVKWKEDEKNMRDSYNQNIKNPPTTHSC